MIRDILTQLAVLALVAGVIANALALWLAYS